LQAHDEQYLIRRLPWSIAHNTLNTTFFGLVVSGPIFLLFTSSLGFDTAQIGLLLSLLPFAYLVAPFVAGPLARRGYRRTYLFFWSIRYVIIAGLLLVPWISAQWGLRVALLAAVVIIAGFSLCRAIGDTAFFPWLQEFVPERVLGKYFAVNSVASTLANFVALTAASRALAASDTLSTLLMIIAAGLICGALSIVMAFFIPGGAPAAAAPREGAARDGKLAPLGDANLVRYLIGYSLVALGTAPLYAFLPLIAQDRLGLSASTVVLLQSAALFGGVVASYAWGRMADRRGGKAASVLIAALYAATAGLWLIAPGGSAWITGIAFALALVTGAVSAGWSIASTRLLYASVIPPRQKAAYSALYLTWTGVVGGLGPLLAGRLLAATGAVALGATTLALDAQTALLALGILLPLLGMLALRRTRSDAPPALQAQGVKG
jgi:MFS family permease